MRTHWLGILAGVLLSGSAASLFAADNPDPYEGLNRKVFWFNERVDGWLVKPIAERYVAWVPGMVRSGVSNFFANLEELANATNNLLQGKPGAAGSDLSRFVINSSVGFFGFLDTASRMGLDRSDEDLGQTLGSWGVTSGPFVMVPFLGPRTLRDALAYYPNSLIDPTELIDDDPLKYSLLFGEIIDLRADLLQAERMIVGDRYTFIRDAYLQRRDYQIRDGEISVDAFEDFDDDFFE